MEQELFEDLLESVREAGGVLRGEREAARRTSLTGSGKKGSALGVAGRILASREPTAAVGRTELVFRELTGIGAEELRELLLGRGEMPEKAGARRLRDQLAELLGCRRAEASELLGASASRFQRNDLLSRDMLDRAYAVVEVYAGVAAVLGSRGAATWFGVSHQALGGAPPLQLLKTDYGRRLVQDLVGAATAGSYV